MVNNLYSFDDVIAEIENHLEDDISIAQLAAKANMSVYEFRRIFTFVVKMPIGEYIRKRRLSVAAQDLIGRKCSVTEASMKYGYDSTSSFTRAFKALHGVSPSEAIEGSPVKMVTRMGFSLITTGGDDILYTIVEEENFDICGFRGISSIDDTECCENVWSRFYEADCCEKVMGYAGGWLYTAYENGENTVECYIGARNPKDPGLECLHIPSSTWACFKMKGNDDEKINRFYRDVLCHWLESGKYEKNNALPNVEIFPVDMEQDDFEWEIRIPIKKMG